MNPQVAEIISQGFYLTLVLSMLPIIVASIVGILFALFQAVTQLQEQTLSFGVKLIAVCLALFLCAGWISSEILRYGKEIFDFFYLV